MIADRRVRDHEAERADRRAVNVCGSVLAGRRARGQRVWPARSAGWKVDREARRARAVAHDDRAAGWSSAARASSRAGWSRAGRSRRAAPRARRRGRRRPASLRRSRGGSRTASAPRRRSPAAGTVTSISKRSLTRTTSRFVPSRWWPTRSIVSPIRATGWLRRRHDRVEHRHRRHEARARPPRRGRVRSRCRPRPRLSTGSGARAGCVLWISTTDAMYAAVGRKWLCIAVQSLDISSVLRYSGVILISSIWSSSPESASARKAGGNVRARRRATGSAPCGSPRA